MRKRNFVVFTCVCEKIFVPLHAFRACMRTITISQVRAPIRNKAKICNAKHYKHDRLYQRRTDILNPYLVGRGKKGRYVNGLLKTAKSFIQYCYDEGYGGFNTKKNFKWCKEEKVIIVTFKPAHVRQMMSSCGGNDFLSVRDKAVLSTLFETGIRCWELCCIKPSDHNRTVAEIL